MTIEFTPAGFDAFQNNISNVQTVGIGTTNPLGTLQVGSGTSTFIVTGIGSVGIGTTNPTASLTIAGVGASINAAGDVKSRRSSNGDATVTMSGTPANIATIVATGNVGLVTFSTTGIAATVNVTGMISGQVLDLFISNPTTTKTLTLQYAGTAIPGTGIATVTPAQGASIVAAQTRYYRFMVTGTTSAAPVVGDIRVFGMS